jgi:hypothetical protein
MQTEKDWMKSAYAQMNNKFINIGTYSGNGMLSVDREKEEFFLECSDSDEYVGRALLSSIENSEFLTNEKYNILRESNEDRYKEWVKKVIKKYQYQSKNDLFKPMFSCYIGRQKEEYLFDPSHQRALNSWEGTKETEANKFTIPLTATAVEMGAALRRCLALCTSKFDPPKDA